MRAIANRIEYTPTAIYHHFKDKDALIIELCHGDFRTLAREFSQIERIGDPVERLRRIGMAYVEFAMANPHHYQIMFMTRTPAHERSRGKEPGGGRVRLSAGDHAGGAGCRPLSRGAGRPARAGADDWSGVHGIVSLQIAKCHDPWVDWRDMRTTAARIIDALIRGILREGQPG